MSHIICKHETLESHPLPVFDNPYGYPIRVWHLPKEAPQSIFSLRLRIYIDEPCSSSVCSGMANQDYADMDGPWRLKEENYD